MFPTLKNYISKLRVNDLSEDRKRILLPMITYVSEKLRMNEEIVLNFICTHNSRRSQLAQIWAQTAAYFYDIDVRCLSGGVEVTAFNHRAVATLERAGFQISAASGSNPEYRVQFSEQSVPLVMFSKLFDDPANKAEKFAAIMTCSDADENCPFIPGTEKRIPVRYDDPKSADDTPAEVTKYDERCLQIANEMFYVFSKVTR